MRVGLVLVVCLGLAACDQKNDTPKVVTERHADGTETTTVTGQGNGAQITVGSGAGSAVKMPGYAPLYPGGEVQTSISANASSTGGMVMFKSRDSADAVIAFYRKSATAAGLADVMDTASGDTKAFTASSDKTKHRVSVVTTRVDDGINVQVTWSDQ